MSRREIPAGTFLMPVSTVFNRHAFLACLICFTPPVSEGNKA
nr:hypothetical protein [Candidatus Sigynarchaeota archaeon]